MTYNEMYPVSAGEIVTISTAQYNAGSDTTISVADGTILQSAPNYVTIRPPDDDESGNWVTVKYTGKNAMSLTGVTIVYGSSTAALTYTYPLNSRVYSTLTKAVLDVIQGNITDHQTRVTAAESDIDNLESGKLSTQYSASEDNYIAKVDPTDHVLKVMAAGTTTVAWNDVTNKPTEFPPAAHTQAISTVTGLQTALDGKVNVDGDKVLSDNNYADADKAIVDGVTSGLSGKVDKVTGKGLSENDYTTAEKTKLAGIADNAQVNTIEVIKVNGTPQTITDKAVNLIISGDVTSVNGQTGVVVLDAEDVGALPDTTEIPTKTSDLTNDSDYQTETEVNTLIAAHNSSSAAHADIRTELDAKLGKQYAAAQDGYIAKVDSADHVLKVMAAGTTSVGFADITGNPSDNTNLNTALTAKVDKVTGKQLSQNDYTNADKTIVDGVTSALSGKVDVAQGVAKKDYFLRVNAAGNVEAVSYAPSGTQWGSITGTMSSQTDLQAELDAKQATISDIATIRSNASAGKTHADITTGNPHNVTKGDVGLGNVNNTADADKPISTATQTALDAKVDAVSGKGLSTNDYTTAEKTKLAGIAAGAEVNTIAGVQKNGTDLTPDANKKVNVTVPTALSEMTDDTTHRVVTDTQISTWNGKANAADVTALGNRVTTAEGDIDTLETAVAGKEPAITKNTAFNKNFGTSSGTVCEGNDARLSDARTPTSHASTHSKNGTDEVSIDATQVTSGTMDSARLPVATTSAVGGVKIDGTTITIDGNGVISSQGGGGGGDTIYTVRITKGANADGVFVTCSNPAISVNTYQERLTIIQSMCRHCLATAGLGTIRYVQEDNFLVDVNGNAVTLDNSQGYGDFLLEVDNIWWTIDEDANNIYWKFTKKDMSGGTWQSAHKFNGTYREKIYYGVFNGVVSDGRLMSIASTAYPASTQNIDDFYTQAHNGGTTYHIENLPQRMLMIGLHLFLYATKNIQSIVCGLNKGSGSSVADCQAVNAGFSAIGGWTQGTTANYNTCCMTMGIMNYFGKQWQFTGETIFNGGNWKFAMDANDHYQNMASGSYANAPAAWTVVQAGTATNLSQSYVGVVSGDARAPFIPVSSGGSSTTYYCDAAWSATGDRCCFSGASVVDAAGMAGLFAFAVDHALSSSGWALGARLLIHGGV